jgi:hypothetical protein
MRPTELRQLARDRGDLERYHDATDPLVKTLEAMLGRGRVGELFAEQTTTPMRRDRPTVFDLSSIDDGQDDLQRAALLACWSAGFGSVAVGSRAGGRWHRAATPSHRRDGRGVARIAAAGAWSIASMRLSRLNRTRGVGTITITHTLADLEAVAPMRIDRRRRAGAVRARGHGHLRRPAGGRNARAERDRRTQQPERELLTSWVSPPSWDTTDSGWLEPPGRGRFLAKVGGRPGLPFRLVLTAAERALADSNERWQS